MLISKMYAFKVICTFHIWFLPLVSAVILLACKHIVKPPLAGYSISFAMLNQALLHIYCKLCQNQGNMASNLAWGVFSFSLGLNGKLVPRFDYEGFPDTNKTKSVGYSAFQCPLTLTLITVLFPLFWQSLVYMQWQVDLFQTWPISKLPWH